MFIVLVVPAGLVYVATGSSIIAISCTGVVYLAFVLVTVWSIRVSKDGIRFVRMLGSHCFLGWNEITSVEEASRTEVVLRGWFALRFPAREMTITMSALGHFRIQWLGGWCYFPPKNPTQFREIVPTDSVHARDRTRRCTRVADRGGIKWMITWRPPRDRRRYYRQRQTPQAPTFKP